MTECCNVRFSIDTGGTFTDIVVIDESDGNYFIEKVSTTPANTLVGVLNAIDKAGLKLDEIDNLFMHGSTTALNAMLERKGVKTAFVTTAGFRDVPEIMRFNRAEMYNPKYRKPQPIVPREMRFEVSERVTASGEVLAPLNEDDVRRTAIEIAASGARAVAVCLLHAHRFAGHEQRIKQLLEEHLVDIPVVISSQVAPEHREFERGMTTILNAYLAPVVDNWIRNLQTALGERGFKGRVLLTKSDGGAMTPDATRRSPINMLLSGPAGGVTGGVRLAEMIDVPNLITMDVGGTSFDIAMIRDGVASINRETELGGYPFLIPNLDIRTIGAGGGSIAWIDGAGAVHVGPHSASAVPGPVCYGRGGTEPTVTDAFLVNGFIEAETFLGGEMALDEAGARKAILDRIAEPLGLDAGQASSGILRITMNNMAEAVKSIAAETGDDHRRFDMLCFGGGGPMFGAYLVDELGMQSAIIPPVPSTFSAFGMLMVDVRHEVAETIVTPLDMLAPQDLERRYSALEKRGQELLDAESIAREHRSGSRIAELRYAGQEHAVSIEVAVGFATADDMAALYASFEKRYASQFGYALHKPAELVNIRVIAVGEIAKPSIRELEAGKDTPAQGTRLVQDFITLEWQEAALHDRDRLKFGDVVTGPALIIERTTTTVVRAGQLCRVDRLGNLLITRVGD